MRKLFKNLTAIGLSVTMVVGTASMASAAVAKGTDVSNGKAWTSYSIHTREDNGSWEDKLIGAGQKYQNKENTYKSYGEDAKITTQTSSSFTMNVVSTGWSANWTPMRLLIYMKKILQKQMERDWLETYMMQFLQISAVMHPDMFCPVQEKG